MLVHCDNQWMRVDALPYNCVNWPSVGLTLYALRIIYIIFLIRDGLCAGDNLLKNCDFGVLSI